jgi:hypothetical protein
MSEPNAIVAEDVVVPTSPPVPEEHNQEPHSPPSGPGSSGTPDPILAMIERASRDPAVDIEKFERLMAMKERVETQRASIAFAEAFALLQPDLPTIDRKGRIVIYSKADRDPQSGAPREGATPIQKTPYATMDDILEALRTPLGAHGFSIRFEHLTTDDNRLITTAILRHRTGHEERATTPPLKHDSTGSKNDVQAVGSALAYGRRYALMAVLPIVSHAPQDADDDGHAAGSPKIDVDQLAYVEQLLRDTASNVKVFLETLGAAELGELNVKQFKRGVSMLEEKKRRAAKAAKEAEAKARAAQ